MLATWMRPRTPLLPGAAALTACLAVDVIAIAIGAAVAGTAAIVLEPVAGVLIASGAVLAVTIGFRRRRQSGASCSATGFCATVARWWYRTMNRSEANVGCTLDDNALIARAEAFRSLFGEALKHRDASGNHAVWTFIWSVTTESKVRALAAAESACCSFTTTEIRRTADELRWELTAPPQARTALVLLDDLAKEAMASHPRT